MNINIKIYIYIYIHTCVYIRCGAGCCVAPGFGGCCDAG